MVVIGVQNQPGTTLMTISDLGAIDAEVKVAEADVLRLKAGQAADVTLEALPDRTFRGQVVEIGASALPVTGTGAAAREFKVVVRLENPDPGLRPGLTCDAEIVTAERSNVLTVPLQSVVLRTDAQGVERTGVFVLDNGVATFTPVTTGVIGGLDMEIDGVAEDTPVITGPYQVLRDLQDGALVRADPAGRLAGYAPAGPRRSRKRSAPSSAIRCARLSPPWPWPRLSAPPSSCRPASTRSPAPRAMPAHAPSAATPSSSPGSPAGTLSRRELALKSQRNPNITRSDVRFLDRVADGRVRYAATAQRFADVSAGGRTFANATVNGTQATLADDSGHRGRGGPLLHVR